MRSGRMRFRVQLQHPAHADSRRGSKNQWEDLKNGSGEPRKSWAGIRQLKVAEANRKNQLTVVGSFEIRLWSVPDIDETWRIVHGDRVYNIISIDQPIHTVAELVIIAKREKLKKEPNAY